MGGLLFFLMILLPDKVRGQSTDDYLKAGELAGKITVQILTSDFSGKKWSNKVGAGTIIDPSGVVLTCSHVLGTHFRVRVRLIDNTQYAAEVLGRFPEHDLAVLQFHPKEPINAIVGLKEELISPGTPALCVGFPSGKRSKLAAIIKDYIPNQEQGLVRIGTPVLYFKGNVVPGYSGGPLMSLDGKLLGVVIARSLREPVGLAIPTEILKQDLQRATLPKPPSPNPAPPLP
ncbi:serine protease [bacterium]|nr:serine protease [bacterium]